MVVHVDPGNIPLMETDRNGASVWREGGASRTVLVGRNIVNALEAVKQPNDPGKFHGLPDGQLALVIVHSGTVTVHSGIADVPSETIGPGQMLFFQDNGPSDGDAIQHGHRNEIGPEGATLTVIFFDGRIPVADAT